MANDQFVDTTVNVISAYCNVLELHLKAIAQGANPDQTGTQFGKIVKTAMEGLAREVEFLRFLREERDGK